MTWHPSKNQSVTIWCERCRKYVTRSRKTGKCPFCQEDEHCSIEIRQLFFEAQSKVGPALDHRCLVCGGVFQNGECIECGHSVLS